MIQSSQTLSVQTTQGFDFGHKSGQQQCLDQPIIVAKPGAFVVIPWEFFKIVSPTVFSLQKWQ